MTVRQLQVIRMVYLSGSRGITTSEVADALKAPRSSVARMLSRWKAIGRFGIKVNRDDRRQKRFYVSENKVITVFEKWARSHGFRF